MKGESRQGPLNRLQGRDSDSHLAAKSGSHPHHTQVSPVEAGRSGARGGACNGQRRWWVDPSRTGGWRGDVGSEGREWTHLRDCWAEPNNRKRKTKGDSGDQPSPRVLTLLWYRVVVV